MSTSLIDRINKAGHNAPWSDGINPTYRLLGTYKNWRIEKYVTSGFHITVERFTNKRKAIKALNGYYRYLLYNN